MGIATCYFFMWNENAVWMFVFGGNVVFWKKSNQLLNKSHDFAMPRHVFHRQCARLRVATIRHTLKKRDRITILVNSFTYIQNLMITTVQWRHLHFNEVRTTKLYKISVVANFIRIPSFHQCQPINSSLTLKKVLRPVRECKLKNIVPFVFIANLVG